jgi:hypothetical protein
LTLTEIHANLRPKGAALIPSVPPVTPHIGRPPGRELTDLEVRYLKLLLHIRERAALSMHSFDELLENFVLECIDSGSSTRVMEEQLGVPYRTIQSWKNNAERRRAREPGA